MALIAESGADRAEQLLLITERLAALAETDAERMRARAPLDENEAAEKQRLANAYRLEMARIKQDPSLIADAPEDVLRRLRARTQDLHRLLAAHADALEAVKAVSEGLVQAMAEEVVRQRGAGGPGYGAQGTPTRSCGPQPAILDRSA